MPENQNCVRCARKVSWIGLWDSLALALFKGSIGMLTHSRALMASALYSFHDVVSGAVVLIGLRVAEKPADSEHPYGHGNAEYIVSAFTSILILGASTFIMIDSVNIIFKGHHVPMHWAALGAAIISAVANEIIYKYNICAVRHLNSPALMAHAKHHRADAIASLAVVVAIVGSKMGFHFLDPLVAVFETGHLLVLSADILYQSGQGLMDRAIGKDEISLIRRLVSDVPEVKEIKDIRTRQIGRNVCVDLYVCFSAKKTIGEVNKISGRIREVLKDNVKYLGSVSVIACET